MSERRRRSPLSLFKDGVPNASGAQVDAGDADDEASGRVNKDVNIPTAPSEESEAAGGSGTATSEKGEHFTTYLTPSLKRRLKMCSVKHNRQVYDIVATALDRYLAELGD